MFVKMRGNNNCNKGNVHITLGVKMKMSFMRMVKFTKSLPIQKFMKFHENYIIGVICINFSAGYGGRHKQD
jgi:hypothetical protein